MLLIVIGFFIVMSFMFEMGRNELEEGSCKFSINEYGNITGSQTALLIP
jgi:hypothetical protein